MAGKDQSGGGSGLAGGLQLAVGVGLGALAGNWIDHKYNTRPWGVVIGTVLGFLSGMYLLVKDAFRSDKK
jgi:F0F1-type ATP synthase assembly protein I